LRIFWIGKRPEIADAGNEIYDRKTIAALEELGHTVDVFQPSEVGRPRELLGLITGLPQRTRFVSAHNIDAIRRKSAGYDAVVCSWEPFDALVQHLEPPALLICHNLTDRMLRSVFPGNPLTGALAARARRWQRRWYRQSHFRAVAVLSRADAAHLTRLCPEVDVLLAAPGMPRVRPLAGDAAVVRELVASGTYSWPPKRRDVLRFARDYARVADRLPVRSDSLPPEAANRLQATAAPSANELQQAIRFGMITDRFEAGFKLKASAYIAENMVVISAANILPEFAHIPDHDLFVRIIKSVDEIAAHVGAVAAMSQAELRERFGRFQSACAASFRWENVATSLLGAIGGPSYAATSEPSDHTGASICAAL
jgi:hypothetical protein